MKVFSFAPNDGSAIVLRRLFLFLICSVATLSVWSVPAQHVRRLVRLSDGTQIVATLYGNSHLNWLETDAGEVLLPESDGNIYKRTSLRRADMLGHMATASQSHAQKAPRRIGSQATADLPSTGSPKVPVLLVSFADKNFSVAGSDEEVREYYDLYCNGTRDGKRYRAHGSYGAIRDYFIAQSDSLFQPEFVIIGPVQLDNGYAYYGQNSGTSTDVNYSKFRQEAVRKAVEQFDIDWLGLFDNRSKNQVDMIFFIYAGLGEANGGDENTIWPKDVGNSYTINGIKFASAACCNELRAKDVDELGNPTETEVDGIGIMCHELSHALGLPDFYDVSGTSFGMDIWSVMDYGEYCANGYCPVSYTAYERDFMGWRPLETITEKGVYELIPTEKGGIGYKVVNQENPNEYYVLENRQKTGWDSALGSYGRGLQVTHVDFIASRWNSNIVNTEAAHQRMTIIAANDRYIGSSVRKTFEEMKITWAGNLYPYEQNDSLTSLSTPAATVYTASGLMGQPIYNISQANEAGTIRFSFLENTPTAITQPRKEEQPAPRSGKYDLTGRRVSSERQMRGVYIENGKLKVGY